MFDFFDALSRHTFLQHGVLAVVLSGVACGLVGSFVVSRRITNIAAAIAHSVLGGMGIAYYLSRVHGWHVTPMQGAMIAAVMAALTIGWVTLKARQREDTVISVVWAVGMAIGILAISQTPGYNQELMSYLFGNILMVATGDLWLMAGLDVILITIVWLFYNRFVAVCFDEEFARVRGTNLTGIYSLLLVLVALSVVIMVTVVGVVLVIALLTIPAAIAGHYTRTLASMIALAVAITITLSLLGTALSYGPDLPVGATIIVLSGLTYIALVFVPRFFRKRHKYDGGGS
ncbi:MAG: metal ABC transporter permease [bacterium]